MHLEQLLWNESRAVCVLFRIKSFVRFSLSLKQKDSRRPKRRQMNEESICFIGWKTMIFSNYEDVSYPYLSSLAHHARCLYIHLMADDFCSPSTCTYTGKWVPVVCVKALVPFSVLESLSFCLLLMRRREKREGGVWGSNQARKRRKRRRKTSKRFSRNGEWLS